MRLSPKLRSARIPSPKKSRYAVLFPGQGSQMVGMADHLMVPQAHVFELLNRSLGFDLARVMRDGPTDTLRRTEYAQPAILATSYALFLEAQKKMTGPPVALLGHSLGHYTALVCCGVLSFDDAISLVHRRGLLMSRVCSGLPFETAMAAVRPQSLVLETLPASLDVASHNSGQQLVVSGPKQDIMRLKRKKFLNVSAPFHSRYMENAAREYRKELEATTFRFAAVQEWPLLISNVTAQPVAMNRDSVVQDLTKQMCSTVQWYKSLDYVGKTLGVKDFVVFGPGETMSKFLCQSLPDSHLLSEYY